ncbi:hypothetical protein SAMN05444583_105152 [Rhodococcus maanshanensis]|uniref:Uncharacterized protein n=1 Tax=Rhodococcus maanshanensis TaxID=183556 RepID=A0A1H7LU56_9NOCA|nr:hypothetical protein SAMN05444583_105152 [Rhodococcus maanshanensis]
MTAQARASEHEGPMSTEEIKAHLDAMFVPSRPGTRRRGSGLHKLSRPAAA